MKNFFSTCVLLSLVVLSILFLISCVYPKKNSPQVTSKVDDIALNPAYFTNLYNYDNNMTLLGRGINLGNFFEAPKESSYPFGEGAWNDRVFVSREDFKNMKNAGFKTVRIPVRWSDHALTSAPWTIDANFLGHIETVVNLALEEGLVVVLNTHHYEEMMNDPKSKLAEHRKRLKAIWAQVSDTFPIEKYPKEKLIFELLNEPNASVGYTEWNEIIAELCDVIWKDKESSQTGRKIMVGTANWGGVPGLKQLALPTICNRDNTIITIHYYEPFHFTHQGAEWTEGAQAWIGTAWTGTTADQRPLIKLLDDVVAWNQESNFEIFVGEFGVYTKYAKPLHQKAWTAFIAREAEKRKMSWAYWEYCSGFGAYDYQNKKWRPALLEALVPQS